MELGLVYTPVMAIPPKQHIFYLSGYCNSKCTHTVCIQQHSVLVSKAQKCQLEFDLKADFSVVCLGFASRRNLYICVPAAHPPCRPWGEDSFGEGRQRAEGGAGGRALQFILSGERQQVAVHPQDPQSRAPPFTLDWRWKNSESYITLSCAPLRLASYWKK